MKTYDIAVIPGDGVGMEVSEEAIKILHTVAGKQIVNPVATIESVRLMMDHLREADASADIETGLRRVLKEGKVKTRDMGGNHATSEMGDAVKEAILSVNY